LGVVFNIFSLDGLLSSGLLRCRRFILFIVVVVGIGLFATALLLGLLGRGELGEWLSSSFGGGLGRRSVSNSQDDRWTGSARYLCLSPFL
jgi:hypothetical protein